MDYILTRKFNHAKHCKDGKDRNILQYFLNDVLILEQKVPYDENYEPGFDIHTSIENEYLLDGKLYQTRQNTSKWYNFKKMNNRYVKYPVSKKLLTQFDIPKNMYILIKK